jgi:prepilin-type N-terminal cleavage/methylation domain-containing protein
MNKRSGFTIVELLVVIVVIGVLAAITLISFTGISGRAVASSLQSDLASASKQLKLFSIDNGIYPDTISCSIPDSTTNKCLKSSSGNKIALEVNNSSNPKSFYAEAINGSICYNITDSSPPTLGCRALPATVTIGSQTWTKDNLNVGNQISLPTVSSDNNSVEKYCLGNTAAGCTSFGGIYTWDEMMKYSHTPGAQGVCPIWFHIPTNSEWTTLSGVITSSNLVSSSSFNIYTTSGGYNGSSFFYTPVYWSSSEYSVTTQAYRVSLEQDWDTSLYSLYSTWVGKNYLQSVRCIKN